MRKSLRDSVKDIIHRVGVTSILVTHDQEEAFDIADKVVIFNRYASCGSTILGVCDREKLQGFTAQVDQLLRLRSFSAGMVYCLVQPTL